jgi:8-oxo-dGTP pyrophosphatase MutT (NUDIX family)
MGAGILPVALHKGVLFLLMGQERKNNLWCDFGGTPNKKEKPFETAIREGGEELNGFLGVNEELENIVNPNMVLSICFDRYTTYIFKTNYDEQMPKYFNNVNNFAELHFRDAIDGYHNGLFEKTQIKWMKIDDLKTPEDRKIFRPWYIPIVESIVKNEKFIIKEIKNIQKKDSKERKKINKTLKQKNIYEPLELTL